MDQRISKLESDMVDVKTRLAVAESNIKDIKDDIVSIKGDTSWLRRAFANAGLTITGGLVITVLGGVIVWALTK